MRLKILAQGKLYVVIHKPSGLVTYADSKEQESISAKAIFEAQTKRKVFPVHRIDKDTCGVLTFGFSAAGAQMLTALFRSRTVKKQYLALVHGEAPVKGLINEPLEKNKSKVKEAAETEFTRLFTTTVEWEGEMRAYSLVRCEPRTGRYHQIRRHLRFIGCPIVGDPQYGNKWDNRAFLERFKISRTLLCASTLAFPDRENQKMVRVSTKPDQDFLRAVAGLGWKF
ncbi:MAG: RNA pseudouridine synthase [Proteobacteria bacterium]|nr:MAG: RNA pseudouridine synthase [Pseudomonadota bacterium]